MEPGLQRALGELAGNWAFGLSEAKPRRREVPRQCGDILEEAAGGKSQGKMGLMLLSSGPTQINT